MAEDMSAPLLKSEVSPSAGGSTYYGATVSAPRQQAMNGSYADTRPEHIPSCVKVHLRLPSSPASAALSHRFCHLTSRLPVAL